MTKTFRVSSFLDFPSFSFLFPVQEGYSLLWFTNLNEPLETANQRQRPAQAPSPIGLDQDMIS